MVEIPRLVAVETTSHCNARCPFCPHGVMARGHGPMDDDLFAKIIEDCRAFPLPAIEPFLVGDPFSDPQILDRLALIRRRLPKTALRLYTNGHALTPQKTDAMRGLRLDHLFISLNTLDPARYEAVMGLRLERTLDNLAYLLDPARRDEVARRVSLRMTRLADTTLAEQDAFLAYCRDKRVRPLIVGLFNYKGDVGSDLPVPRHGCEHTGRLDILADGRVTLCCMDQEGEHGWGSVRDHSVLELYRHREARRYRDAH
ncbi:MAG: radical SAM protein, partial [Myxococcales bacterium]|nr:radical SAM protein [Myxococcales bacterium]